MAEYSNCKCIKCGASFDSGGLNVDFGEYTPYDDSPRYDGSYDIYPSSVDQVLETKGMLLEEDIIVHKTDISDFNLQEKTITPSSETQVVLPDGPSSVKVWDEYSGYNYVSSGNANSIRLNDLDTPRYARLNGEISFRFGNSEPEIFTFNNVIVERMDWTQSAYLYQFYPFAGTSLYSGTVEKSGNLTYDGSITGILVRKYHLDSYGTFALTYDEPSSSGLTFENVTLEFSDDPAFPSGFDGLSKVTVNPIPSDYIIPRLQSKVVDPSDEAQVITASGNGTAVCSDVDADIDSTGTQGCSYVLMPRSEVPSIEVARFWHVHADSIKITNAANPDRYCIFSVDQVLERSDTYFDLTYEKTVIEESGDFINIYDLYVRLRDASISNLVLNVTTSMTSNWEVEIEGLTVEYAAVNDFESYTGLSKVVVNAAPLQEKTVTPSLQTQIVAPEELEKDIVLNHITDSLTIDSSDRPFYGYIYNVNYFERKRYARLNGLVKMTRTSAGSENSSTLRFTNTIAEMVQESSTNARYTFYDYENPGPNVEVLSDTSIFGSRAFHIFSYNINTGSYAEGNTGLVFSGAVSSGIWEIELTDVTLEFSDDPSFSDYYGLSQVIVNPIGQWFADQGYIFVSSDETLIYGDWDEALSRITNGDEIPTSCCVMINGVSMHPTFWVEMYNEDLNLPEIRISVDGYSVLWFEDGTLLINQVVPF